MDGIVFIAMNPVSNMHLSSNSHAVTNCLHISQDLDPFLQDQSALLVVADNLGSHRPLDLEPKGQNMTICLLGLTLQGVWTDWSRLLKRLCPLTAGLRRSSPGDAMMCVFLQHMHVSKRVCPSAQVLIRIFSSLSRHHHGGTSKSNQRSHQ